MNPAPGQPTSLSPLSSHPTYAIGCVSFLNSKPLIEPLINRKEVEVHFAVPSQLLGLVEKGTVSTALMSVVDFQTSSSELLFLPAGMIGCDGPTLTVRLYSRVPPEQIHTVHGDTDSHTSIILAQLILRERFGIAPPMLPLQGEAGSGGPEAMLLIGDKVVNASPDAQEYAFQLDLGEQWKLLTGLPFVFAMWMIRADRAVGGEGEAISRLLSDARRAGAGMTEVLLDRYAEQRGWPRDLARRYFTEYLRYEVTAKAREGLAKFFELAQKNGLLECRRAIRYLEVAP